MNTSPAHHWHRPSHHSSCNV